MNASQLSSELNQVILELSSIRHSIMASHKKKDLAENTDRIGRIIRELDRLADKLDH